MVPLETASILQDLAANGLFHGFTTRAGGVSRGCFASLNLGRKWGDDPALVQENFERVMQTFHLSPEHLGMARQVHGLDILSTQDLGPDAAADGLFHRRDDRALAVGVLTADCVPILLADGDAQAVAALHSGWRGTVGNIAARAVARFWEAAKIPPERLRVAIGPCIETAAFEVGEEVAAQFPSRFVQRVSGEKPHVDLVGCVRAQLLEAGVLATQIERVGACTKSHPERYFSYRREGERTGQHLSFIGLGVPA